MCFNLRSDALFAQLIKILDANPQIDDLTYNSDLIEFEIDDLQYIINKHFISEQIWLSSAKSGPHHFCYKDGAWINKNNQEILSLIESEICK